MLPAQSDSIYPTLPKRSQTLNFASFWTGTRPAVIFLFPPRLGGRIGIENEGLQGNLAPTGCSIIPTGEIGDWLSDTFGSGTSGRCQKLISTLLSTNCPPLNPRSGGEGIGFPDRPSGPAVSEGGHDHWVLDTCHSEELSSLSLRGAILLSFRGADRRRGILDQDPSLRSG